MTMVSYGQFFAPLASPVLAFLSHALLYQIGWMHRLPRQVVCVLACLVGSLATLALVLPASPVVLLELLLLCALINHGYFHFFNMSETARRIRILRLIAEGVRTKQALGENYSIRETLNRRLERLGELRWIEPTPKGWRLRNRLVGRLAALILGYESLLFPLRSAERAKALEFRLPDFAAREPA